MLLTGSERACYLLDWLPKGDTVRYRCLSVLLLLALSIAIPGRTDEGIDFFQQKIRPIFSSRCQGCHNDTLRYSGRSLDSAESLRKGGLHGPVVVPGDPQTSRLYRKISGLEKPSMPMQGDPLTADEVALLKRWIELKAPWPEEPKDKNAQQEKLARLAAWKKLEDQRVITEKDRQWWSFRKPVRPPVPQVN